MHLWYLIGWSLSRSEAFGKHCSVFRELMSLFYTDSKFTYLIHYEKNKNKLCGYANMLILQGYGDVFLVFLYWIWTKALIKNRNIMNSIILGLWNVVHVSTSFCYLSLPFQKHKHKSQFLVSYSLKILQIPLSLSVEFLSLLLAKTHSLIRHIPLFHSFFPFIPPSPHPWFSTEAQIKTAWQRLKRPDAGLCL